MTRFVLILGLVMGLAMGGSARAKAPEASDYEIASLLSSLPGPYHVLAQWLELEQIASFEGLAERHRAAKKQEQEAQFGQDVLKQLDTALVSHPRIQADAKLLRAGLRAAATTKPGFDAIKRYNRGDARGAVFALQALAVDGLEGFTPAHLGRLALSAHKAGALNDPELTGILNRAVNFAPDQPLFWLALMEIAQRAGDTDALADMFKEAQSFAPDMIGTAQLMVGRADLYLKQGDQQNLFRFTLEAQKEIERALARDKKQPELGRLYAELLGYQLEALTAFSQLEAAVGVARNRLYHVNELILAAPATIPLRTMRADTYLHLARLLYGLEQFDEARIYFERARTYHAQVMARYPRNTVSRVDFALLSLKLGDVLAHLGDTAEAKAVLTEGLEQAKVLTWSQPDHADAWRYLGDTHLQLAQLAQQAQAYDEALTHARATSTAREKLIALEPDVWWHRAVLISTHVLSAQIERDRGDQDAALSMLDEAEAANQALAEVQPGLSVTQSTTRQLNAMRAQLTGTAQATDEVTSETVAEDKSPSPATDPNAPLPLAKTYPVRDDAAETEDETEPAPEAGLTKTRPVESITEVEEPAEPETQPAQKLSTEDVLGIEQVTPKAQPDAKSDTQLGDMPAPEGRTGRVPATEAERRINQIGE